MPTISRRLQSLVLPQIGGFGAGAMSLADPNNVDEGGDEFAQDPSMLEVDEGGYGMSPDEQMALQESGMTSSAGSFTPMQITPLSERFKGHGAPTKQQKIADALSDIFAGGFAGASVHRLPRQGNLDATLNSAGAGFQASQANRIQRERLLQQSDQLEFGRQAAMYNADLKSAQVANDQAIKAGESASRAGYFENRGHMYEARAKQIMSDLNSGILRAGQKVMKKNPATGQYEDISGTPESKAVQDMKAIVQIGQQRGWSEEQINDSILKHFNPQYKTKAELDAAAKVNDAKPAVVKDKREQLVKQVVAKLISSADGDYAKAKHGARVAAQFDPEFPLIDALKDLTVLEKAEEDIKKAKRPQQPGIGNQIAQMKRDDEKRIERLAGGLAKKYGLQGAYDKGANEVTDEDWPAVQIKLKAQGAKPPDPNKAKPRNIFGSPASSGGKKDSLGVR